ncbi:MAG: MFS transporter [Planctomycetes bacterium]|nr:MFS transporter [Planctomycetota bacterium]
MFYQANLKQRVTFKLTLAACLIFWIFVFVDSGWGPDLTPLSLQLHSPLSIVGLFYVVWSTGYLPGALVGGAMLDRYGPRRVLFAAALIIMCGMTLILLGISAASWKPLSSYVPVVALLVIAAFAGSGGGVIDATTNGLISSIYAHRRASALNLFNLLYPLGGVCIALIDAGLLTLFHNDPRPPLIFTICFTVAAMLSLLGIPHRYLLEAHTNSLAEVIEEPRQSRSLLAILTPVIVVMMLTSGISSSTRAWTPAYLHVAYGQTPAIAAALSSVSWLLAASSRLGASILILRIGAWRMVMLGVIVSLLGLIGMAFSPNAPIATLAIALTSIGLSPIFATCLAIGSERAGRSPGAVAGILLFAAGISTVFCSWFFGFLLNGPGPLWAVAFCFVCMVTGGVLALRLRT